jgi:hypothetical protein
MPEPCLLGSVFETAMISPDGWENSPESLDHQHI